jgi:hypothetical protein
VCVCVTEDISSDDDETSRYASIRFNLSCLTKPIRARKRCESERYCIVKDMRAIQPKKKKKCNFSEGHCFVRLDVLKSSQVRS